MRKIVAVCVLLFFFSNTVVSPVCGEVSGLPLPGTMLTTTSAFTPLLIKGLKVHSDNPFLFDFIIDTGNSRLNVETQDLASLHNESTRLIKYFLASLAIPEKDLWVNLSPYEKDRVMTDVLAKTELGRDMLAQDYILKQLTASLIYPENGLGQAFWKKVYAKAQETFGTTEIPVDTFNKVWIKADKARVLEKDGAAYILGGHLKVMLESDYLAAEQASPTWGHVAPFANVSPSTLPSEVVLDTQAQELSKQIVREIILPALEKEVNEGEHFAPLRQMFYAMVLASWYKTALKDAVMNKAYTDQGRVSGVLADDIQAKEKIYAQYLEAYKKGVFNYIKEDVDASTRQPVVHKYFSGGLNIMGADASQVIERVRVLSAGDALDPVGSLAAVAVEVKVDETTPKVVEQPGVDAPDKAQKPLILIVEDEPSFQELFEAVTEGIRSRRDIVYVANLEDAQRFVETNLDRLQFVMTDTNYPLDPSSGDIARDAGVRLYRWLQERYPNVKILAMSVFSDNKKIYPEGVLFREKLELLGELDQIVRDNTSDMSEMVKGGIDLNGKDMAIDVVKRGQGIAMGLDPVWVEKFKDGNYSGLVPVILKVTSLKSVPGFLGMSSR